MKVKFGMIVTDGSGKLGGQVMSSNKGGKYIRTKVTPSNPNTVAQQMARAILSSLSTAWAELTSAQRLTWNGAVANFAKTDIFGDIKNPSGFNLFVKLNAVRANIDQPALLSAPEKAETIYSPIVSAVLDISSATLVVTFGNEDYDQQPILVAATPQLSQGISNFKSRLRGLGWGLPDGDALELYAQYVAKFGVPAAGANVYLQTEFVAVNGQKGTAQSIKVLVQA